MHRTRRPARRIRPPGAWEQIWRGEGEGSASIVAGALEAQGFRTRLLANRSIPHAYPGGLLSTSWAILVPAEEAVRARQYLRESDEGANVYEGDNASSDQALILKAALAGLFALVLVSAAGVLFGGWNP